MLDNPPRNNDDEEQNKTISNHEITMISDSDDQDEDDEDDAYYYNGDQFDHMNFNDDWKVSKELESTNLGVEQNIVKSFKDDSDKEDPEHFEHECLDLQQVAQLLDGTINYICNSTKSTRPTARALLKLNSWNIQKSLKSMEASPQIKSYYYNFLWINSANELLVRSNPSEAEAQSFADEKLREFFDIKKIQESISGRRDFEILQFRKNLDSAEFLHRVSGYNPEKNSILFRCEICLTHSPKCLVSLNCNHKYCVDCWQCHVRVQLDQGVTSSVGCMSLNCNEIMPEEMCLELLLNLTQPQVDQRNFADPYQSCSQGNKEKIVSSYQINSYDDFSSNSLANDTNNSIARFKKLALHDAISTHPQLRWCPGADCSIVIHALQSNDFDVQNMNSDWSHNLRIDFNAKIACKKVTCKRCNTCFCFGCSLPYHAPADCLTIKKWLAKCEDDSETLNYIAVHTKDCPKCNVSIEKNGGCNHMQCYSCRHNFCWICKGDWKTHGTQYYECSRYRAPRNDKDTDPTSSDSNHAIYQSQSGAISNVINCRNSNYSSPNSSSSAIQSSISKYLTIGQISSLIHSSSSSKNNEKELEMKRREAREQLSKYLFYYERYENHARSLKLEAQTTEKIKARITDYVNANKGTWIDWQYLLDAAQLLASCRYTLQYTYPYAYYSENGPRKQLFEYQQAQLEAEIENLSWKLERAESHKRGDIESQMCVAERRRRTLLKEFQSKVGPSPQK